VPSQHPVYSLRRLLGTDL